MPNRRDRGNLGKGFVDVESSCFSSGQGTRWRFLSESYVGIVARTNRPRQSDHHELLAFNSKTKHTNKQTSQIIVFKDVRLSARRWIIGNPHPRPQQTNYPKTHSGKSVSTDRAKELLCQRLGKALRSLCGSACFHCERPSFVMPHFWNFCQRPRGWTGSVLYRSGM